MARARARARRGRQLTPMARFGLLQQVDPLAHARSRFCHPFSPRWGDFWAAFRMRRPATAQDGSRSSHVRRVADYD